MQAAVNIPPAPGNEAPPGHDAAMLARYEAGQAAARAGTSVIPPAPAAETPTGAPVAPASAPAATAPAAAPVAPVAPAPAPAAPAPAPSATAENDILVKAGVTREALAAEFAAGGISKESYAKLASAGISRADFDQYIAGRQAQADAYASTVFSGGGIESPEQYAEVVGWAATSLSPAEIAAFNTAVGSGDAAAAAFAVAGLKARFVQANPAEPGLIHKGVPSGGTQAYESWAQVSADMKKPEYRTDPAFRDQVRDRLAASPANLKR